MKRYPIGHPRLLALKEFNIKLLEEGRVAEHIFRSWRIDGINPKNIVMLSFMILVKVIRNQMTNNITQEVCRLKETHNLFNHQAFNKREEPESINKNQF
jgi:hypothetical protein